MHRDLKSTLVFQALSSYPLSSADISNRLLPNADCSLLLSTALQNLLLVLVLLLLLVLVLVLLPLAAWLLEWSCLQGLN